MLSIKLGFLVNIGCLIRMGFILVNIGLPNDDKALFVYALFFCLLLNIFCYYKFFNNNANIAIEKNGIFILMYKYIKLKIEKSIQELEK